MNQDLFDAVHDSRLITGTSLQQSRNKVAFPSKAIPAQGKDV